MVRTAGASMRSCSLIAVEIRFALVEFGAAFDRDAFTSTTATILGGHLGALLAEQCLPRQLDAIAFDGEDLHKDLVAFVELVGDIVHAVFGDLADVQQTIGP